MSEVDLLKDFLYVLQESALALLPLAVIFALFQLLILKLPRRYVFNAFKGLLLAFFGLLLFLYGVQVGFMPAGYEIGRTLGESGHTWALIPVGFALALLATLAEPAVRILSREVEGESGGYIARRVLLFSVAASVSVLVAAAMARVVYDFPFHYLALPGYALAIGMLVLLKPAFAPVAFDSGGVATGPMTVSFIAPVAIGAVESLGRGDPVTESFGLISLVALAPIISVMILSILFQTKENPNAKGDADEP